MAVLDASFLIKLVLREPSSEKALAIFEELSTKGEELRVHHIALAETLNSIWKHSHLLKEISHEDALRALKRLLSIWSMLRVHQIDEIAADALNIALKAHITVYDALYIALAQRYKETLYTFDAKLASKARELEVETKPS